jgi:hypothetical protein
VDGGLLACDIIKPCSRLSTFWRIARKVGLCRIFDWKVTDLPILFGNLHTFDLRSSREFIYVSLNAKIYALHKITMIFGDGYTFTTLKHEIFLPFLI